MVSFPDILTSFWNVMVCFSGILKIPEWFDIDLGVIGWTSLSTIMVLRVGSSRFGTFVTSAPQERRKQRTKLNGKWQRKMSRPGRKKRRIGLYEKDDQKEWKTVTVQQLCC